MILYTDINKFCCRWLTELVRDGLLPHGDVLCADMTTIDPQLVEKYHQRHWCCGIGGWPYALKLAGWPADRPVDTCSLPCQPFSTAGKQKGLSDERHLWPAFRRIITELSPATIFGEQVPEAIRLGWLDGIFDALEAEDYACGAVVLPACSVGAPQIRQRIWWLAHSNSKSCDGTRSYTTNDGGEREIKEEIQGIKGVRRMVNTNSLGFETHHSSEPAKTTVYPSKHPSPWSDFESYPCFDRKLRRAESGVCPLAPRLPGRVGTISSYGNSIVPQVAAEFIIAFLEGEQCQ